jgi:hypothetical protein
VGSYRPGSELFVVYTDERDSDRSRFARAALVRGLKNRAFVVKVKQAAAILRRGVVRAGGAGWGRGSLGSPALDWNRENELCDSASSALIVVTKGRMVLKATTDF